MRKNLDLLKKSFGIHLPPIFLLIHTSSGSDNIPPPIGKTPPNTPNKNFLENFKNKMIKINKQVNLNKTNINNEFKENNQDDIFLYNYNYKFSFSAVEPTHIFF